MRGLGTPARHLQQLEQSIAAGCKHSNSKSEQDSMDVNDNFCRVEEELFGSEGGRESAGGGGGSSDTLQETAAKQTRKRPREATMKIAGEEEDGAQGKSG